MEEDWELLHAADVAILAGNTKTISSVVTGDPFEEDEENPCDTGAIKADYFALAAAGPSLSLGSGEIETALGFDGNEISSGKFGGLLSDGWSETEQVGIGGNCLVSSGDFSGLWSEGSSGSNKFSVEMEENREKGEILGSAESTSLILDKKVDDDSVDSRKSETIGSENSSNVVEIVEKESSVVISAGDQVMDGNFGEVGSVEAGDDVGISLVEMEERVDRIGDSEITPTGSEKKEVVWWKLPLDLLKFCAFRVRTIWSIPIAVAVVGIVMLGRRLYRMKRKSRTIPLKISLDDKKASQLMVRAAKLNEVFSVVKRVPLIRSSIPVGGSAWPILPLRSIS